MSYAYLRWAIILLVLTSVSACGGGGGKEEAQAPKIEYAQSVSVADGTLADYMNADWLYQNYLGEYSGPRI